MKKCRFNPESVMSPLVAVLAASCELIPGALVGLFIRSGVQWSATHDNSGKTTEAMTTTTEAERVPDNPCGKASNTNNISPGSASRIFHIFISNTKYNRQQVLN